MMLRKSTAPWLKNRSSSEAMSALIVISEISESCLGRRFSAKYTDERRLSLRSNTWEAIGVWMNSEPVGGT